MCAPSYYVGLTHYNRVKVFYRARYMGDTLEVFMNSDGDPSQFAISPHFSFLWPACLSNCAYPSPYPLQRGMSSLPRPISLA
jgi:hypothetical protein